MSKNTHVRRTTHVLVLLLHGEGAEIDFGGDDAFALKADRRMNPQAELSFFPDQRDSPQAVEVLLQEEVSGASESSLLVLLILLPPLLVLATIDI